MKKYNKIRFLIIIGCGFFLFIDRFLKLVAFNNWTPYELIQNNLGWRPFFNYGVAFGLPVPSWLTIIISIPIILFIFYLVLIHSKNKYFLLSWMLVLIGALSNFYDRLIYGYVIDYFSFFTSIINLADIFIVVGIIIYFLTSRNKRVQ